MVFVDWPHERWAIVVLPYGQVGEQKYDRAPSMGALIE